MSSAHHSAPERPAGRYGTRGPVRRHLRLVVSVALGLALAAWAVWAGLGSASGHIQADEQGYKIVDDSTVVVVFRVAKPADQEVVCTVQALSSTSAVVGLQQWPVGADAGASSVQTVTVKTQQRAVTGVVDGCRPT
ncbi:protein of unknown function [Quadrisphaera granulorum]|uniref:Uncharacterized protein DUF4307 n=1 Tax=Quadrisphaera granulorum TaxID=317664 RepID=A0A316AEB9_9ACTN|nr:DUF4307 domain-containing protein [Quadrisphaera granulorum]PWJ56125.1 uncharacterized protein DUF4307 [Quadrisphaera granulorum]SZE94759.1 protein of unknown function [Quadrisphaera granulorum]